MLRIPSGKIWLPDIVLINKYEHCAYEILRVQKLLGDCFICSDFEDKRNRKYVIGDGVFCICSNDGVFEVALQVHVQVYSNGRVTWTPPALFCSSCGVKVNGQNFIH